MGIYDRSMPHDGPTNAVIRNASIGMVGYQGAQLGYAIEFDLVDGGCVCGTSAFWGPQVEVGPHTQWSEETRSDSFAAIMREVGMIIDDANVREFKDIIGKPALVMFNGSGGLGDTFKAFRIYREMIL